MTNPLARYLDPLPLIAVLRGITPEEIPAVGAALVGARLRHPRGAAQFAAAVRLDRRAGRAIRRALSRRCRNGLERRRSDARQRRGRAPDRDAPCRYRRDPRGEAAADGVRARRRDADRGICRARRRRRRPEDVSGGAAAAPGAEGLAGRAARRHAALSRRRHQPGQAWLAYWEAGAAGFGTGSCLYKPGATVPDVTAAAAAFAAAVRRCRRAHRSIGRHLHGRRRPETAAKKYAVLPRRPACGTL